MKAPVFLLAFILCGLAAVNTSAATLVVTKTEDTNDGACDADCSLREAVVAASPTDTVIFSSLFSSAQTITLVLGQIELSKPLTIVGPGTGLLEVSGNNASRILYIHSAGNVSLTGMTLRNGRFVSPNGNPGIGGAILLADSDLSLTGVTLRNNSVSSTPQPPMQRIGFGGAIYSSRSTISLFNSTITDNTMPQWPDYAAGGGIYVNSATDINIVGSVLSNNREGALHGGRVVYVTNSSIANNDGETAPGTGVGVSGERITVLNSTVSGNNGIGISCSSMLSIDHATITGNGTGITNGGFGTISNTVINNNHNGFPFSQGGGISNIGTLYVINTAITNNGAIESGGGIYNALGDLFLTNATVSGNITAGLSDSKGGGIYNASDAVNPGGRVFITNSTIANNRASGFGGGVRQEVTGSVTLRNTIVSDNTSDHTTERDASGAMASQGYNLIADTTGSTGWIGTDLLNFNPMLAPLGNDGGPGFTHAILPGSPAINAGNNDLARDPYDNSLLLVDQRGVGFMRIVNNTVDIGAYEANYANGPVTVGGRVTTIGGRGISNVRVTLTNGNEQLYAQTNPFGYYRFAALMPGTTYTVAVIHKYYQFDPPLPVTIDQPRNDVNFTAQGP